jgi:riboflavin synthase
MFTGIVETKGRIAGIHRRGSAAELEIAAPSIAADLTQGQSVSVAGACLTVTRHDARGFRVTAVDETLRRTVLGELRPGDEVNLERAVRVGDRLDGHIVQGHVDGVGRVVAVKPANPGTVLGIRIDRELMRYVAMKGSIAIDGVSLTVAGLEADAFRIALIPHTLEVTTLGRLAPGRRVNVEVDVTARYIERLMNEREVMR